VFIEAKDGGSGGDNWSYKSCKLQSSSQIITTKIPTPSFGFLVVMTKGQSY